MKKGKGEGKGTKRALGTAKSALESGDNYLALWNTRREEKAHPGYLRGDDHLGNRGNVR